MRLNHRCTCHRQACAAQCQARGGPLAARFRPGRGGGHSQQRQSGIAENGPVRASPRLSPASPKVALGTAHGDLQLRVKGTGRLGAGQKLISGIHWPRNSSSRFSCNISGPLSPGLQRSGRGGKTHHPYHRAAGVQGLHSVVDALPGQGGRRLPSTVRPARSCQARTARVGSPRQGAVHRHGGHIAVVGRQPPQVELHGPHGVPLLPWRTVAVNWPGATP